MSDESERMTYVAIKPACGCQVAMIADIHSQRHATAKVVADWIVGGIKVERRPAGRAAKAYTLCHHEGPVTVEEFRAVLGNDA